LLQGGDASEVRGRLAEARQPLIKSYVPYRQIPWVNVYAKRDIISGDLNFYDKPDYQGIGIVNNQIDDDALIPIVAHGEYWENKAVFRFLVRALEV
jgi:hypothetical protein